MEMQNLKFQNESEALMKCPRCDSLDTKFCYYNNYNYSQPRHFCKSCRRYWTIGGLLRNVPVGGGTRKSKSSKSAIKSPSIGNSNSKSIPICDDPQFMNSSTPVNNAAAAAYAVPSSSVIYHHDALKMKGNEFGMSSEMGGFTAPVRMNEGEMEELMKIYGSNNNNNNNNNGGGGVDEAANFWFKFCGLTNTPFNN